MNVGIFGGSFNPPHIAHLVVAESIRDQFDMDSILWIPGYIPPHKTHLRLVDAEHRMEMTKLAISSNPNFDISAIEIERKGVSFTVDTLRTLTEQTPDINYHLVIGEDSLYDFMTWRQPAEILSMVKLLVYRRPGKHQLSPDTPAEVYIQFPDRILFADAPLLEVSSASIRNHLARGKSIRHLVPNNVYDYIYEHGLYDVNNG